MPEVDIVSMTALCVQRNSAMGGIMRNKDIADAAPARDKPTEAICLSAVGRLFMVSVKIYCVPVAFHSV